MDTAHSYVLHRNEEHSKQPGRYSSNLRTPTSQVMGWEVVEWEMRQTVVDQGQGGGSRGSTSQYHIFLPGLDSLPGSTQASASYRAATSLSNPSGPVHTLGQEIKFSFIPRKPPEAIIALQYSAHSATCWCGVE